MSYKVTVRPAGREFTVEVGQNVLSAALIAGVELPYSCRNGTCCSCRGRVVQGSVDAGKAPARILEPEELAQGYTLLCQAKPLSDLVIEATEVELGAEIVVRKMPVRLLSISNLASDVVELCLQLPSAQRFIYKPGQYLDFLLNDGSRRSYSMACASSQAHKITLHIRRLEGGAFSPRFFGASADIKPRDIMRIEGPLGSFFLRADNPQPIIFLASGTGFAPIKAIIEHMRDSGNQREVLFYWGGRKLKDLYLHQLASSWALEQTNFHYVPVLSEVDAEDDWAGRVGLVHQAVLDDFADLSGMQVYACGSPLMVRAARNSFVQTRHLDPQLFYADAFTNAADQAEVTS